MNRKMNLDGTCSASRSSEHIEIDKDFLPVKPAKKKDMDDLLRYVDQNIRESAFFRSVRGSDETNNDPDEYET